ncbi:acetyl-CoA carboxylase biotin carboxyl carrier protein [Candidatus Bodocaedibacter vickermanii]|uniref:Biotin carboxyl carrier protein of acetyl-CoA carboxylase n=1 Tax=Candidatus Bodocaedibacter vickermanii TaxID=2741701 RepID=A0A7L9RTH5_9PROT|nr:Biotin carboxyl carrier protein of acetyl-CoA carboxylase [Candidatus Paracaedibacteraceae bacterium 'Lake Konstanz']
MTDKKFSFDIDQSAIQALAKVLQDADLSEIEYEDQGRRVRLTRNSNQTVMMAPQMSPAPSVAPTGAPQEAAVANPKQHPGALKSPMVGTLYAAPEPGAATFTKVGNRVNQGDTVFIIEAMKVMNPIKAHTSGVVKEIFFSDGNPVEYGDVLIIIE